MHRYHPSKVYALKNRYTFHVKYNPLYFAQHLLFNKNKTAPQPWQAIAQRFCSIGISGGVFMPQMNKGGKFIFGKSLIRTDGTLRIPPQAMEEYHIADEGKVYLFTGSKITGGFCVTRKGLLHPSKLGHILDDTPPLLDYSAGSGEFIKYKGRSYCWVEISQEGQILLTKKMMDFLKVRPGMELLSIRSSDIAFTMGAKGPLLEKAENYDGEIPLF